MDENCNQLKVVSPEEAVNNEEYLQQAFQEVLRWEEADKNWHREELIFRLKSFSC